MSPNAAQVADMVQATTDAFGAIDVLVNNAAVFARLSGIKPFEQLTRRSGISPCQCQCARRVRMHQGGAAADERQGHGKVINVASGTAFKGTPGMLHYVASKGAVVSMTRSLANELGKRQHHLQLHRAGPGDDRRDLDAARHRKQSAPARSRRAFSSAQQKPEDLAGTLIYLASADSDFVTGQIIVVDGGSALH